MAQHGKKRDDPSSTSAAYETMLPRWRLINALLGGTETMKAAGGDFLPRYDKESDKNYHSRLEGNVLANFTELTLNGLVGKPFSEPITIGDDVPEAVADLLDDVDMQGNGLNVFARGWFRDGLAKALSHVLVDFPVVDDPEGTRTLADDRRAGLRPHWVHIPPENVIFIRAQVVGGVEVLTHVRILEEVTAADGFDEATSTRIRVLEPGSWAIYEQDSKGKWFLADRGLTTLPVIPLVTFYADREGLGRGKPPLTDLAHLNKRHWVSNSDQINVLTVARFPILAGAGVPEETESGEQLVIGPKKFLTTQDPQGKYYYVEHSGAAIEAGAKDLLALEGLMAHYGAEFLTKRPGNEPATSRILDSAEALSSLEAMVMTFKDALEQALDLTAAWLAIEEGGGSVSMDTDLGTEEGSAGDLEALDKSRTRRDISRKAHLAELRRRDVLMDGYDAEEDAAQIEEESSALIGASELDLDPGAPDDDDEGDED